MGAWATLILATRLCILDLHMMGDSKIVIDWLNGIGSINVANLDGWKDIIHALFPFFRSVTFAHIYRERNKVADSLSKKAFYMPQGHIAYSHWLEGHEGPIIHLNL
jgi:hypothetical protein